MFELKYDILDELDARQTNCAERVIDESEGTCEYATPQEYYREMARAGCTHLFSLTVLDGWMIDLKRMVEEIQAVAENYFDDCPSVMCVYNPWEKVRSLDKINEIVEEASQETFVNLDNLMEYPYEIINIRIPIKIDGALSRYRRILKMINFLIALRRTYFKYHRAIKFRNLCYARIESEDYFSTKEFFAKAPHYLMQHKSRGFTLDELLGGDRTKEEIDFDRIDTITKELIVFFNGSFHVSDIKDSDILLVVEDWWKKYDRLRYM